ncbi:MAG: voltage-gated potassium channel [Gammaproteobacteria bacterium]|nr:MAG: voltage-gated potassium channel [Gammaproteobacteria bacterium]RLA50141.1 MAG: voltage-gated potassium channel [Gammaproteobacteria bacterium]
MLKTLRARAGKVMVRLSKKAWFPRGPIALAVALLGLLHIMSIIDHAIGLYFHLRTPGSIRQDLVDVSLSGTAHLAIGVFLLIISVGLWVQSRTAWLLSVLVSTIGIVVLFTSADISTRVGLISYHFVLTGCLLASYRYFDRSSVRFGTMAALVAVVVLVGYTVLGTYQLGDQFSPHINNLSDATYVAVVTVSTVGFGDFTPATATARLFMASVIVLSLTLLSTAIGATLIPAMVGKIQQLTGRNAKVTRNDHYIIIGFSALANNTYRDLTARGEQVTVIVKSEADGAQFADADVDIVTGDGGDLETLRKAGAEQAKGILALMNDDSENAFVILAVKELKTKARTVAAVNEAKHLNRVRRVHPDMIIAPQVLGGELLTSMLTGEHIDIKDIMGRLLGQKTPNAPREPEKTG